jgi:hypothetical protein
MDSRRQVEFTGLGIPTTLGHGPAHGRNVLTWFRESATPAATSPRFSNACPRPGRRPPDAADDAQAPVLRHFSVISAGK